jgi:hypothetical protein
MDSVIVKEFRDGGPKEKNVTVKAQNAALASCSGTRQP